MPEVAKTRTGVERAAILLLTLGESEAAEILKHMGAKDVQRLGRSMAELTSVSRDEVRDVLGTFTTELEARPRSASAAMNSCARCWSTRSAKKRPTR